MKMTFKKTISLVLAVSLSVLTVPGETARRRVAQRPLDELVGKSYLELLDISTKVAFSRRELDDFRKSLERERQNEKQRLQEETGRMEVQLKGLRRRLDALNRSASRDSDEMATERRAIHCQALKLENGIREKKVEMEHGLPLVYENKLAKLDLMLNWPARRKEIREVLASGRARDRRFGDVEDIGIRKVGEGQEKDLKLGQDAIRELKSYGLMPFEEEDRELKTYVQKLADTIAVNSDLKVPVKLTLLESEEINAFALPGGYLFVNLGLIEKAGNESELAGVMAHELAHVAARHSARLMTRVTIANVIFQAAQIAAMIFTGGVVGIGTYYALQYGFFGLGMVLDLSLLGVSREFEAEADQLGVQYAWRAGYDPRGFITFFDKMASEKGYVRSASFFRTHPPFYDRILSSFSEIEYLPPAGSPQVDSSEFRQIKERLKQLGLRHQDERKNRPTLKRMPPCDDEPAAGKPQAISPGG